MPVYKCPKCGRTVELPEGKYYCKVCGPSAVMVLDNRRPEYPTPEEVRERFIKGVTGSSYEGINWSEVMREFDAVWAEAEKQLRKYGYTITKEQFLKLYEPWLADILEIESFQDRVLFVVHEAVEAEEVKKLAGRWVLPRDYYEEVKRKTGKTVLEPHIKAERIAPYEAKVLERARKRFVKGVTGSSLGGSVHGSRLKWVRDSAGIWWTATTDYIHSLYYDEEDKVYVWYVHSIKDFEELKREILYPPAEYEEVFEARDIEDAKKHVEEKLAGYYKPQLPAHAEKVDELVRARESGYRRLKRLARAWEKTVKSSGFKRRSVREVIENPRPDEFYVLVTRYVPIEVRVRGLKVLKEQSGVFDVWDRDLAPSPQLLSWWKAGPKTRERWEEYKRRFLSEVPEVMIRRKADIYREWAKDKTVVFVCEEEEWEYPYCHTWIILEVLEKT